jgi:hypothetical protein
MSQLTVEPTAPSAGPPIGRIVLVVLGAFLLLVGLFVGAAGTFLVWAHATQRDADGFYTSGTQRLESVTRAITSEQIDLGTRPGGKYRRFDLGDLATVRLRVESQTGAPVFVGIGPDDAVARYLDGVAQAQITDIRVHPFSATYRYTDGGAPSRPPGDEGFWAASAEGTGVRTLEWDVEPGHWTVVVMNADGSPGVGVAASVGVEAGWVLGVGVVALTASLLLLPLGAVLLVTAAVSLGHRLAAEPATERAPGAGAVRLEGRLDPHLSRWLWVVKGFLLIPHFVVLAVLWIAFSVVTVVAWFSILLTERYPRPLFDFNLGVLRWTWRVAFYSFGAFGTDLYPPFTLGAAPDYPATYHVAYPERLSRGQVLVKWWLLAIPHYVVLGILGVGLSARPLVGAGSGGGGPGLIAWLVLVAAVVLLFTTRYPRGLFDFIIGLDRWVYRVIPYVALMTDEYPPFRLDQGGSEPPSVQGPATAALATSSS